MHLKHHSDSVRSSSPIRQAFRLYLHLQVQAMILNKAMHSTSADPAVLVDKVVARLEQQIVTGGLKPGELFVIAGDQNSDPLDGDSIPGSIQQLLEHPLVNTKFTPRSPGAVQQSALQGGANLAHRSDPAFDTADFADSAPGRICRSWMELSSGR